MKTFDEMKHPRGQAANAGQFREVTNSAPTSDLTETEDVAEPGRYRILVDRLRDLGDAIEKANRRLQRAGVTERFEATWVERIWRDEDGRAWHVADVELNRPVISSGEWTFVASHEKAANGKLLSHYVGTGDRDGLEVDPSMRCDHCGRARARQKVYTLRSPQTGETKQIGSNCLQLFLGLRPEGLWSMTAEVGADLAFDADDESWSRVRETNAYEGDELLLATIRQVAEDGSFMSRSRAGLYATPTMDKVKGRFAELTEAPATTAERAEIAEVVAWVEQLTPAEGYDGDYERNLQAAISRDDDGALIVGRKHAALVGSAISSHRAAKARKAREDAKAAFDATKTQEFVFEVGENLRGKGLELKVVKSVLGQDYGYGRPLHVTFMDDEGHILYWKSSSMLSADVQYEDGETGWYSAQEGDRVRILGGSVKEHRVSDFNGDHETVLTRVKIAPTAEKLAELTAEHEESVRSRAEAHARHEAASAEARAYQAARFGTVS